MMQIIEKMQMLQELENMIANLDSSLKYWQDNLKDAGDALNSWIENYKVDYPDMTYAELDDNYSYKCHKRDVDTANARCEAIEKIKLHLEKLI